MDTVWLTTVDDFGGSSELRRHVEPFLPLISEFETFYKHFTLTSIYTQDSEPQKQNSEQNPAAVLKLFPSHWVNGDYWVKRSAAH